MAVSNLKNHEVWFVTGSQHLYGPKTLEKVAQNSQTIAEYLNDSSDIPVTIKWKPTVKTADEITAICKEANTDGSCIGLVLWMHTFSPAKMWIEGLRVLDKPFLHLHTQFNRDIPWSDIDMNYMNLHQSAHGCREFGFSCSRMRINRRVVVGHREDPSVPAQIGDWARAAAGVAELRQLKVARFGDNMRDVAVTEGDKVEAKLRLGVTVDGFGVGDLVESMDAVSDSDIDSLIEEIVSNYSVVPELQPSGERHESLRYSARIEHGIRSFLDDRGYAAFTTTFEDLHGLKQLPGFAVQRLMKAGYGFGAEGDWKTSALLRTCKVMGAGLKGGASFMEDYTYHLEEGNQMVLGAHMLEVCESIAAAKPSVEIHRLGIGKREDPIRSLFTAPAGNAINISMMDMGNRFRLLANELDVKAFDKKMPKLPVACALWAPKPDLATSAAAWIQAGGAHHSVFTMALNADHLRDFAEMLNMELLLIDANTDINEFKKEIRINEVYYQ